jgi:hypothetical protein
LACTATLTLVAKSSLLTDFLLDARASRRVCSVPFVQRSGAELALDVAAHAPVH